MKKFKSSIQIPEHETSSHGEVMWKKGTNWREWRKGHNIKVSTMMITECRSVILISQWSHFMITIF